MDTVQPQREARTLIAICDMCKKDVGSLKGNGSFKTLRKGFLEFGLSCPHCGFWGHGYFTTQSLEMDRKALNNFKAKARLSTFDRRRYEQKLAAFQQKYQRIQKQAKKLTKKVAAPA